MHEYYNTGQIKLFNGHLVGLVGIGNVGAAIARRLNALGVSIIAYDSFCVRRKDWLNRDLIYQKS